MASSEAGPNNGKRPVIFLSHRRADKAIADVLRGTLESWIAGRATVVQPSGANGGARTIGQSLSDKDRQALSDANVVMLIYTVSDDEWFYCMWECGLATDPSGEGTRVVVLQCGPHLPAPLGKQMTVTIDEAGIRRFTHNLLKARDFFPGSNDMLAPEVDEREIEARSQALLDRLSAAMAVSA